MKPTDEHDNKKHRRPIREEMLREAMQELVARNKGKQFGDLSGEEIRQAVEVVYELMGEKLNNCDVVYLSFEGEVTLEFRRLNGQVVAYPVHKDWN